MIAGLLAVAALPLAARWQDGCQIPSLPDGVSMHLYVDEPEATKCWPSQTLCPSETADCQPHLDSRALS